MNHRIIRTLFLAALALLRSNLAAVLLIRVSHHMIVRRSNTCSPFSSVWSPTTSEIKKKKRSGSVSARSYQLVALSSCCLMPGRWKSWKHIFTVAAGNRVQWDLRHETKKSELNRNFETPKSCRLGSVSFPHINCNLVHLHHLLVGRWLRSRPELQVSERPRSEQ